MGKIKTVFETSSFTSKKVSDFVGIKTEDAIYVFLDNEYYLTIYGTDSLSSEIEAMSNLSELTLREFVLNIPCEEASTTIVEVYKDYDITFKIGEKS